MRFYFSTLPFLAMFLWGSVALSQERMPLPPHASPGVETGMIRGEAFFYGDSRRKIPAANQKVVLLVKRDEEQVLMLDKMTDNEGEFVFKNIFKDPSFSYSFAILYHEKLYILPRVHLEEGETEKFISIEVGEGSPLEVSMEQMQARARQRSPDEAMPPPSNTGRPEFTVSLRLGHTHQWISLFLCGIVFFLSLYFSLHARRS